MKRIYADFNCGQDDDGLMRLNCHGSLQSLKETGAKAGDFVIVHDEELEVEAVLVEKDSLMYARFEWDSIRDSKPLS